MNFKLSCLVPALLLVFPVLHGAILKNNAKETIPIVYLNLEQASTGTFYFGPSWTNGTAHLSSTVFQPTYVGDYKFPTRSCAWLTKPFKADY